MTRFRAALTAAAVVALACLALPRTAHAYVDPGSGSLIIQVIVGAIAGSLIALKFYWARVKDFFSSRSSRKSPPGETDA